MLDSLNALFENHLKDLYSAERQLVQALPRMAEGATSPELRAALESHLDETRGHLQRLEQVAKLLDIKLAGKHCAGMEGLIDEGEELLEEEGAEPVLDAGLIIAAQKVEHYEISAYGSACAVAEQLGLKDAVMLLQQTLDEETAADKKLSSLSEGGILSEAAGAAEETEEPRKKARR